MTLNCCIANADGGFWEPFPWGEEETAFLNEQFREADTWALGRKAYETIVPWWDGVAAGEIPDGASAISAADREFAALQKSMSKVVFSAGRQGHPLVVWSRDPRANREYPRADRRVPAVRDPAVLGAGPQVFEGVSKDLSLDLAAAKVFSGGAVVLRYRVVPTP